MATDTHAQLSPEFYAELQSKALEAVSAVADMNHRVLQELVAFSASTAKEGMRAYAELQSAAVDAAKSASSSQSHPEAFEELRRNPFAWYQKALLALVEGTQQSFRLLEANGQVVSRSAERLQASADRTAQEIQEALTSTVGRMKEVYGRN